MVIKKKKIPAAYRVRAPLLFDLTADGERKRDLAVCTSPLFSVWPPSPAAWPLRKRQETAIMTGSQKQAKAGRASFWGCYSRSPSKGKKMKKKLDAQKEHQSVVKRRSPLKKCASRVFFFPLRLAVLVFAAYVLLNRTSHVSGPKLLL